MSDITYLRTLNDFVYLFLITDLYSRKIVGWLLSRSLAIEGAMEALRMALHSRKDKSLPLTHHSDRGIQYCSTDYVRMLQKFNVQISMTQENHCYENSTAERVNGILKDEFYLDNTFHDYLQTLKTVRSTPTASTDNHSPTKPTPTEKESLRLLAYRALPAPISTLI